MKAPELRASTTTDRACGGESARVVGKEGLR